MVGDACCVARFMTSATTDFAREETQIFGTVCQNANIETDEQSYAGSKICTTQMANLKLISATYQNDSFCL
jgi:hypothetical protein